MLKWEYDEIVGALNKKRKCSKESYDRGYNTGIDDVIIRLKRFVNDKSVLTEYDYVKDAILKLRSSGHTKKDDGHDKAVLSAMSMVKGMKSSLGFRLEDVFKELDAFLSDKGFCRVTLTDYNGGNEIMLHAVLSADVGHSFLFGSVYGKFGIKGSNVKVSYGNELEWVVYRLLMQLQKEVKYPLHEVSFNVGKLSNEIRYFKKTEEGYDVVFGGSRWYL